MPLRTALAISFSLHLLLLSPWSALHFNKIDNKEKQIEVTYILEELIEEETVKEMAQKAMDNLPQKYDLEKKEIIRAAVLEEEGQYIDEEKVKKMEEYIAYYELIREKIKKYVTRYYARFGEKGRVEVIFTLRKNGTVNNLEISKIEGSNRAYLEKTALKSINSASPFPPFPEALKRENLTFTLAIIFKKG